MSKADDGGVAYRQCEYSYVSVRDVVTKDVFNRLQEASGNELPCEIALEAAHAIADRIIDQHAQCDYVRDILAEKP